MRGFLVLTFLLCFHSIEAQTPYNQWSLDMNLGLVNAIGEYTEGYISNPLGWAHLDAGARYMLTDKFGAKIDVAFDRIKNDEVGFIKGPGGSVQPNVKSLPFETHYFRISLQAVLNLGRIAEFENIHPNLGCLVHFGFGMSSLKDERNSVWFRNWKYQGTDEMFNALIGIQPQWRLNSFWALHGDLTVVANGSQSKSWDFRSDVWDRGMRNRLINYSVGVSRYFGKKEKHLDWVIKEGGVQRKDSIVVVETVRKTETTHISDELEKDEKDEKDEPVDDKRSEDADFDGDGVPNKDDACPTEPGDGPTGCPSSDRDNDGVRNDIDDCPDIPGIKENGGCPDIHITTKIALNQAQTGVKFVKNKPDLVEGAEEKLDQVVDILKEHPDYFLELRGHTDNLGEKEPLKVLSLARAETVKTYLVDNGISADRIWCVGLGDTMPLAPNDNPAGREQNRRVEFKIKFKKPDK